MDLEEIHCIFSPTLRFLFRFILALLQARLVLAMDKDEAYEYLSSLLNSNLRIHTTDGRMFRGTLKCTDPVCLPPRAK
jgi:hypothetical protein